MKKRLLSLLLAVVMLLGMLPVSAFASELDAAPVAEQTEVTEPVVEQTTEPAPEEATEPTAEETTEPAETVVEETEAPAAEEATEPAEHQHTDENGDKLCDGCGENLNKLPYLIEGVKDLTVIIQTGLSYQLHDLSGGKIFTDDDDTLTSDSYKMRKSSDGGSTWGNWEAAFKPLDFGGITDSVVNSTAGIYVYQFKAFDAFGDSEDTWTLTLDTRDVVPSNISFYLGQDQNYKTNGNVMPVLELYVTAGIDENYFDYIGWFEKDGKTVYVYNPAEYEIIDGETDYVVIDGTKYVLHGYEKVTFTNSAFNDADESATASGTVVSNYNMFYATLLTDRYSTRVYGYNTATEKYDIYLGGQSMELPREKDIYGNGGNDIYLRQVSVYTTSKKVDGTYFTADDYYAEMIMPVTGSMIHSGTPYVSGNYTYFPFFSWVAGNGSLYNCYVYPYDTEQYIFSQAINNTTSAGTSVVTKSMTVNTAVTLKVTVPADGDFGLYLQYNNFNTKEIEPTKEAEVNGDGTKTITYKFSKGNGNYTYRLTDPAGKYVTKAGWIKCTADTEKAITFSEFTNKASHDFSKLGTAVDTRDEADIQVFLSDTGFKGGVSEKTRIRAYRMWQIIDTDAQNIMIEPDFNIQVLQGNRSDITLVSGGNVKDNWIDVKPTTTDIVAVNYDALEVIQNDGYSSHGGFYPATNPERTNVFIITNETAGTAVAHIPFNGSKTTDRGAEWDYNYDTWFYLNSEDAPKLNFTVTGKEGIAVSYATVITDASLKSTLSGWTEVTADENGNYYADLLKFRNAGTKGGTVIIKMTDSTGTSYALARVAEFTANVVNVSNPGEPFMPGDEVSVTFDGLYRSINKISGVFNPLKYQLRYTSAGTEISGTLAQYQQMDNTAITLSIPADLEFPEGASTVDYTFTNGYVFGTMYSASSPFHTMYLMTDTGMGTNFSAVGTEYVLSRIADIPITVQKKVVYDTKIQITDGENVLEDYTITLTGPDGTVLTADENGIYQDLAYGDYGYAVSKKGYIGQNGTLHLGSANAEAVVDGILTLSIALEKAPEGAWDGETYTEPVQVEGVYQISNGAELAWFAQTVNAGTLDVDAVLTKDIHLGGYNWTPIGNNKAKYAGTFDGMGFAVTNMVIVNEAYAAGTGAGLFGYGDKCTIKNLTVDGAISLNNTTTNVATAYAGGVLGGANKVTLENLHSDVDITITRGKGGNWARAGGILGGGTCETITGCSYTGTLNGYQYCAGIAGYLSAGTVSGCYNAGTINTVTTYAAGIVASCAPANIIGCYNVGTITAGTNYAGGIVAAETSGTISNCFNAGVVSADNYVGAIVGNISKNTAVVTDNYYLEGTCANGIGATKGTHTTAAVSAETMASAAFVDSVNKGLETPAYKEGVKHPILTWQPDLKQFNVTLPTGESFIVIGAATVKEGANYTFTVEPAVGYKAGKNFAVKVNGESVALGTDGKYIVSNVNADLIITVEGMEKIVCEPVSVYLSMSHDESYLTGAESDTVMAFRKIEVPYFDLALYGMESFYFSSETYGDDGDGEPGSALAAGTAAGAYGKVTMLHLFIYATEVYYCGLNPEDAGKGYLYNERMIGTDTMTVTGSVGSIYFNKLWGMDENLNYYHNYQYPLASEGWGSTADQILLKNGDIVTVGHFSDWNFYTDPGSVFNYIKAGDDVITTKATRGESVKLSVVRAGASEGGKYATGHTPVASQPEVYCIAADQLEEGIVSNWTYLGTADAKGEFVLNTNQLAAGQYIVAVAGQYGLSDGMTDAIVSAPGGILLTVEGEMQPLSAPVVTVTANAKGGAILTWEAVPEADGYQVYRATGAKGTYTKLGAMTTECVFEAAVPVGKTYYFKVVAVCDADASLNATSAVVKFTGKCAQPAAKAEETNASGKPVLSWDKVSGAKKYEVYRSANGGTEKKIGTTTKTTYTDTKAVVGVTYTYRIKAIGAKSAYNGTFSEPIVIRAICAQPALTIKIDAATGKPNLTWKSVTGAASYEIRRSESADGEFTVLEARQYDLEYFDTTAQPDKDYWYQVVAVAGEEALSSATTAKTHTTLAKPVVTFCVDAASGKPTLSWDAVDGAVSYKIYRSAKATKSYKVVKTVTDTSYTDTSVSVGKGYYYKVVAVGETSNSAYSAYKKLTAKCAQPEITVAAGTGGKPVIKWGKVASAKKYNVYRATAEDGKYRKVKTVTGTSYTDTSAKVGNTYFYKVMAVGAKSACNSAYSEVKSCLTVLAQPSLSVSTEAKTGKPVLSWKRVKDAVKYEIYRDGVKLAEQTKLTYTDESATIDGKYTYKVVAVGENAEVNRESAEKSVTCACGAPVVTGKLENKKPLISWEKVDGAVKYQVCRSTKKSGGFKLVGTVEDGESYADTAAKKGTTYYYKVIAVTEAGNTGAYSNTVKVKSK